MLLLRSNRISTSTFNNFLKSIKIFFFNSVQANLFFLNDYNMKVINYVYDFFIEFFYFKGTHTQLPIFKIGVQVKSEKLHFGCLIANNKPLAIL